MQSPKFRRGQMARLLALGAVLLTAGQGSAATCRNGIYVTAQWVTDRSFAGKTGELADHLGKAGIRYVFVYGKGLTRANAELIDRFFDTIRRKIPDVQFVAMVGRRVCGHGAPPGCTPVSDERFRRELTALVQALWALGFHGAQLDLEPVDSGDQGLVELLELLRRLRPPGKFVSLAGFSLQPDRGAEADLKPTPKGAQAVLTWSRDYYRQLLARTDQVMVMNYDTALWSAADYQEFTAWQTRELLALVPSGTNLQIGLPSDVQGRSGLFDRKAENLSAGLVGVRRVVTPLACPTGFGITIFTVDGMTPASWQGFQERWASPDSVDK